MSALRKRVQDSPGSQKKKMSADTASSPEAQRKHVQDSPDSPPKMSTKRVQESPGSQKKKMSADTASSPKVQRKHVQDSPDSPPKMSAVTQALRKRVQDSPFSPPKKRTALNRLPVPLPESFEELGVPQKKPESTEDHNSGGQNATPNILQQLTKYVPDSTDGGVWRPSMEDICCLLAWWGKSKYIFASDKKRFSESTGLCLLSTDEKGHWISAVEGTDQNGVHPIAAVIASQRGALLMNATVYVTHLPCTLCSKLLAQAKLKCVVIPTTADSETEPSYSDVGGQKSATKCGDAVVHQFLKSGIILRFYDIELPPSEEELKKITQMKDALRFILRKLATFERNSKCSWIKHRGDAGYSDDSDEELTKLESGSRSEQEEPEPEQEEPEPEQEEPEPEQEEPEPEQNEQEQEPEQDESELEMVSDQSPDEKEQDEEPTDSEAVTDETKSDTEDYTSCEGKEVSRIDVWMAGVAVLAAFRGDDDNRAVGAVLASNGTILSVGWNGMRSKASFSDYPREKSMKLKFVIHAEQNAFIRLTGAPPDRETITLYSTYHPCDDCQHIIAANRVSRAIWIRSKDDNFKDRGWIDNAKEALKGTTMICFKWGNLNTYLDPNSRRCSSSFGLPGVPEEEGENPDQIDHN